MAEFVGSSVCNTPFKILASVPSVLEISASLDSNAIVRSRSLTSSSLSTRKLK